MIEWIVVTEQANDGKYDGKAYETMIYCQAKFLRGSGIGTRLPPWARCTIFSRVNNIPMLKPQWIQPRVGPLLRGGIDLKAYHRQILLMGLFRARDSDISGFKRIWLQCTASRETEPDQIDSLYRDVTISQNKVITFAGDRGRFQILNGWDQFLHEELRAITSHKWLQLVDSFGSVPIGINVRMGNDFKDAKSRVDFYAREATKTPLSWFIDCLMRIRESVGFPAKAVVVSDGTRDALKELLDIENVVFARPGCAISDLLLLAKAKVLIRSGGSSFSAWASFLGQMPTISHPGQSLTLFNMINRKGYYIGEFDPASPCTTFIEQVKSVISCSNDD